MDPRLAQLIQLHQQQQGQGADPQAAPQAPPMPPQDAPQGADPSPGGGMGPDNPFADIIARLQSQSGQGADSEGPMDMTAPGEEPENQLMKGSNPDSSQYLVGAVTSLQKYITDSDDPNDIAIARSIVALLSKLIDRSQAKMTQNLSQDQKLLPRHQKMMQSLNVKKQLGG